MFDFERFFFALITSTLNQMEHDCHTHTTETKPLKQALIITLLFMFVEYYAGFFANSLALVSDAVHMTTDSGAIALSLFTIWLSQRSGKKSYESIGALLNGLSVWVLAGFLVYESYERFLNPEPVKAPVVVVVASVGFLANLVSATILHRSQGSNINIRGAYLHILGDLLGSLAAIVSGVVIWTTGFTLIDPIATLLVSILICVSASRLIRDALKQI